MIKLKKAIGFALGTAILLTVISTAYFACTNDNKQDIKQMTNADFDKLYDHFSKYESVEKCGCTIPMFSEE